MITNFVLGVVQTVVSFFLGFLPHFALPSWLSGSTVLPGSVATAIGTVLHSVAGFLPVDVVLTVLGSLFSVWPVVAAYLAFSWVWRHVPTIAGFGTGDG